MLEHELALSQSMSVHEPQPIRENGGDIVMECAAIALELLQVLRRETEILMRFHGGELLEILPEKEMLTQVLDTRLKDLRSHPVRKEDAPHLRTLKGTLTEVHKANHHNHVFIQGTLEYWQGLMNVFRPVTYGPGNGAGIRRTASAPKGFTFAKEI